MTCQCTCPGYSDGQASRLDSCASSAVTCARHPKGQPVKGARPFRKFGRPPARKQTAGAAGQRQPRTRGRFTLDRVDLTNRGNIRSELVRVSRRLSPDVTRRRKLDPVPGIPKLEVADI